jgi:8-amino-7-oxononanoate synthase
VSSMMHAEIYLKFITKLQSQNRCRVLPFVLLEKNKTACIDFSTNDYLQLSKSPGILKSGLAYAMQYGIGSTGSRLLSGNHPIFETFETQIAQSKKTDKALLFNSGFQANMAVLSALLDSKQFTKKPLVFFDKFNHKSLYEAVKLSDAVLIRYAHNNMTHLSALLTKFSNSDAPKFIVAETLYGMDGDIVDYENLVKLAKQHHALLYLDEAHATGILGTAGYGLSTELDLKGVEHVLMGTFSKAMGGSGAYIACSEIIHQYLINHCAGFIYSTASSPMLIGAMIEAWALLPSFQPKVKNMFKLAEYLRANLKKMNFNTGCSQTHIIPIIYSDPEEALELKTKLQENHIFTSFVQYPTVPKNQTRIRIALNVNHKKKDIDKLLSFL